MFLREAWYVILSLLRQYDKRETLEARQLSGLNDMLAWASNKVPYYIRNQRYHVDQLTTLAGMAQLPVLTKQVLRQQPLADLIAVGMDPKKCVSYYTSGTTGERVQALHDHNTHDYHTAAGVRRFLATQRYWPHYRLSHIRPFMPPKRFFENIGLFRRHVIPAHLPVEEIKQRLLRNRSQVIVGYPVYLRDLLRNLTPEERITLQKRLRVIFSESELLIDEHRHWLEEGFGVPIFDDYSAFEVLSVYFECSHHRKHIVEDRVLVEVLDENGQVLPDGQEGNIVITSFMERIMPLIRYSLGDRGYKESASCPCGRSFRTMRLTRGRSEDYVTLPDGRKLYCANFLHLAAMSIHIDECFVHQDKQGLVRFYYIPNTTDAQFLAHTEQEVRSTLFALAQQPFPLEVVRGDTVPMTRGGKGKFVTSDYHPEPSAPFLRDT